MNRFVVSVTTAGFFLGLQAVAAPTLGSNVKIGPETNVDTVSIDWDPATGDLFAVDLLGTNHWKLFFSSDAGASWTEEYDWGSTATAAEVAEAGGYAYIGYVASNHGASSEAIRIRRASASTGAIDTDFGAPTIDDVYPLSVRELVVESNQGELDDYVYVAALLSDNSIRVWGDEAADGTTFSESSPTVSDAASGLDLAYNLGFSSLALSYVGTDDAIHVYTALFGWDDGQLVSQHESDAWTTSIDAYLGTIVVAYVSRNAENNLTADWAVSDDFGSTWSYSTPGNSTEPYYRPQVSASSGTGLAVLMEEDTAGEDSYWFRHRPNRPGGILSGKVDLTDQDYYIPNLNDDFTSDFQWLGSGWGVAYVAVTGDAWFAWSRLIRYSGFEVGGLDEWSSVVGGS